MTNLYKNDGMVTATSPTLSPKEIIMEIIIGFAVWAFWVTIVITVIVIFS